MPALHYISDFVASPAATPSNYEPKWRLVALHGVGSNADDLFGLLQEVSLPVERVSLQGPLPYGDGYAWFPLEWTDTGINFDPASITACVPLIEDTLAALPKVDHTVLVGFSQGGITALEAVLHGSSLFDGLAMMSSRSVREVPEARAIPPVLIQHGTIDPIIPVDDARQSRERLSAAGANVTYFEYPIGHAVSYQSIRDMENWLAALIARN